jgi:hypothetical protein
MPHISGQVDSSDRRGLRRWREAARDPLEAAEPQVGRGCPTADAPSVGAGHGLKGDQGSRRVRRETLITWLVAASFTKASSSSTTSGNKSTYDSGRRSTGDSSAAWLPVGMRFPHGVATVPWVGAVRGPVTNSHSGLDGLLPRSHSLARGPSTTRTCRVAPSSERRSVPPTDSTGRPSTSIVAIPRVTPCGFSTVITYRDAWY